MTKAISRPTSKDRGYNIPAEVCKFLVDTLESHCDFLVEWKRIVRFSIEAVLWVESKVSSRKGCEEVRPGAGKFVT